MKSSNWNCRSKESGEGLVIVIVLLVIIGGGVWWLFNNKNTMDREAHAFGRQAIERMTVNHDKNFFSANLGPQARLDFPNSVQQELIDQLTKLGVPNQPINIEEHVSFESHFFSPRGDFIAHLFYPAQTATLQIAISHPVGKWQVDSLSFAQGAPR